MEINDILIKESSPVVWAYIGDAWYSLFCRIYIAKRCVKNSKSMAKIHNLAKQAVSAVVQANALQNIFADLTEKETAVVKRGRNTKTSVPKSASVFQYRHSTGFEALLGYLVCNGEEKRAFKIANLAIESIYDSLREE